MAQRRLFSPDIVRSDAFLDMPASSRELYFQLCMDADDDGFVNPKRVMRVVNASDDDLKVLVLKRFALPFENGVIVIKHWLIHNKIRKDRYKETKYVDEKNSLTIKGNGAYTELATNRQPHGNQPATQVKLSEAKVSKDKLSKVNTKTLETAKAVSDISPLMELFIVSINPTLTYGNKTQRSALQTMLDKFGLKKTTEAIKYAISVQGTKYSPTITTPVQLLNKYGELQAYYLKNNKSNVARI